MVDLAAEIVTAIASGAGDSLGARGVAAAGRLISALRARLRSDPGSRGTLEIALEAPAEQTALESLAALLRDRVTRDAEFGLWLANLWDEVGPDLKLNDGVSVNVIHGTVQGNIVQARDVHGNIHIGSE
jgi:hypothetical protein